MPATFVEFFRMATGQAPFPYQVRLAESDPWPSRIEVPTGLGKTLAVVVGWLWRRRIGSPTRSRTGRRLVYCLPMRVLVEQTRDVVHDVLKRLGLPTRVVVLMGGVDDGSGWDTQPEDDTIVIGTQDMLLSRALNRGYGMSRYRWPLHFGLLNTDCQWIVDEVQLVGSGVATTAQLQALRRKLGTLLPTHTSWMSATLEEAWLRTVDVDDADLEGTVSLDDDDRAHPVAARRLTARKSARAAESAIGDIKGLAREVLGAHRPTTRTLVVVNTVDRARELFVQLQKAKPKAALVLLHSRYRAQDRARAIDCALAEPGEHGTILISTQVVEAGVDLTSTTLFTEVAPWASLVQRFGRCNRRGDDAEACVYWVRLPDDARERAKVDKPYTLEALESAEQALRQLTDVGPASLPKKTFALDHGLVLRRRDLLDLFDTTPDLMGNDVDVSRFIRDADDHDLRVCWRPFEGEPDRAQRSPARDELCAAPLGVVRDWLKAKKPMWTWDGLQGRWVAVDKVYPGLTLLLRSSDGGYDAVLGLDPKGTANVPPVDVPTWPKEDDREYEGDPESEWNRWYTLTNHSNDVAAEALAISSALALPAPHADALSTAGRWHDAGKAHPVWQEAAKALGVDPPSEHVAKSQAGTGRIVYRGRPGFRHELASALLAVTHGQSDLVTYLVACHHGKVRLSLRSLPNEAAPRNEAGERDASIRHARGIWEGDEIPEVHLGADVVVPRTVLTLSYMELGDDDVTGPSWSARMLALRDDPELGPFRLGFLEALIKCADERASRRARGDGGGM
jgi:CRISPR-associated endonuclease/helicase Cas3